MLMHYVNRETRCLAMLEDIICVVVQCLPFETKGERPVKAESWNKKQRYVHGQKSDFALNKKGLGYWLYNGTQDKQGGCFRLLPGECAWFRAGLKLCRITRQAVLTSPIRGVMIHAFVLNRIWYGHHVAWHDTENARYKINKTGVQID
jgi:hypothetical protein